MNNPKNSFHFDHREIAVIFSLFVFVSLLMFTVGIVVGKGLSQTKYEKLLLEARGLHSETAPASPNPADAQKTAGLTEPDAATRLPAQVDPPQVDSAAEPAKSEPDLAKADAPEAPVKKKDSEPLKLIPKPDTEPDLHASSLREPEPVPKSLLTDPRIKKLLETAPATAKRGPSSTGSDLPNSFATGKFTVQVGSYPQKKDAVERIEGLKKLGFPHAFLSVKKFQEGEQPWYRVWLGYYPDLNSAKKSGDMLQKRGEVKNFLVRKADLSDD